MEKMSSVKKICLCAICVAMCYVLPIAFHAVGLGKVFSPIHIPVLLCGLICGGGAYRIEKRMSHITIVLDEKK